MATSPLVWMRAVRDHVPKPGPGSARYPVLWALALRLRANGAGFCSTRQLAEDVEVHARTVQRHIRWARDGGYLLQTRRGHRIDAGTVVASEWQLADPTQGDTGVTLARDPTWQQTGPNVAADGTQRGTGATPRGLLPEVLTQSAASTATNGRPSAAHGRDGMALKENAGPRLCPDCGAPWPRNANPPASGLCRKCNEHRATTKGQTA